MTGTTPTDGQIDQALDSIDHGHQYDYILSEIRGVLRDTFRAGWEARGEEET